MMLTHDSSTYSFASWRYAVAFSLPPTLNCMLLWPPHRYTSPNTTSSRAARSPVDAAKEIVCGQALAAVGGSFARQTEVLSATEVMGG